MTEDREEFEAAWASAVANSDTTSHKAATKEIACALWLAGRESLRKSAEPVATPHHCEPADVAALVDRLGALADPEREAVPSYADTDWRTLAGVATRVISFQTDALAALQARLEAAEADAEQLACVRQALPVALLESVASVAVATLTAGAEYDARVREDLAMMIRMLVSCLKRHWPHAPQPGDLPSRAMELLRKHGLQGSPLRNDEDAAIDAHLTPKEPTR